MRINSLKYQDKKQKWELSELDFFNLTLLVGISGVGKTQILDSILNIKKIANGESLNGIKWEVSFTNEGKNYRWEGEFEMIDNKNRFLDILHIDFEKPKLIKESIFLEDNLIANRSINEITFQGTKMPKLSSEESIISIFKEEDDIQAAYDGFKKIVFRDHTEKEGLLIDGGSTDIKKLKSKYKSVDEIKNSGLNIYQKLSCLSENQPNYFSEIVESYRDVFPQVEKVKIESFFEEGMASIAEDTPIIQFKEKGVEKWIYQNSMSSGMLRTFLHISEMHLLSEGTVVLIDEFENSLGLNCIDVLTEDLIFENTKLQFIATSHHPYIINKIPYEFWKIVTRKGGKITTFNAKEFKLGESNHDRFMNLINLPQYKDGIESLA